MECRIYKRIWRLVGIFTRRRTRISCCLCSHMRELRIQHKGMPYRVLYALDPRRSAILLIGGNKTGKDRWYDEHVPQADKLYDEHLHELREEGLL